MDVPVALAIGLAFLASCYNFFRGQGEVWFDSVVMFIFFLSLGRHVEMMLRHRNLQAGAALARLLPEWAQRVRGEVRETVPAYDLSSGDRVLVRAGESFPADGRIRAGVTEVDEALLTGESRAVARGEGDAVIAGTLNIAQPVEMTVTAGGQETAVSSLGRLLLRAQSMRPASHSLPSWLVPAFIVAVLVIALGTWLGWQWLDPSRAFPAMLAVLVASCPCALSLALPVVHAAASRRLLDEGILLTRGEALHALNEIDTAVFDKTGTLTLGQPEVVRTEVNPERSEIDPDRALRMAAALEVASAHPIARAFHTAGQRLPAALDRPQLEGPVEVHPGQGLTGLIDGADLRVGTADFSGVPNTALADDSIWLADGQGWLARFELRDALRPDAGETVTQLRRSGLHLRILSGDSHRTVESVAGRLGIADFAARQTPAMKLAALQKLHAAGRRTLMIGDGVNDAPVLAAADVSMTVKGGAELANSTADLILTGESLGLVLAARSVAQRARQLTRQNLAWAVLYNASVMPLAVSGTLKPWMAALGMSLSSLLVVANASRLVRERSREDAADKLSAAEVSAS
jgi:Cu2+-exporting ATPase